VELRICGAEDLWKQLARFGDLRLVVSLPITRRAYRLEENRAKFAGLSKKRLGGQRFWSQLALDQSLEPKLALVRFVEHHAQFGDELASRSRATGATVVGRDARPRSNQLPSDRVGGDIVRQSFDQVDDGEGESLGSSAEFVRGCWHAQATCSWNAERFC
jgi:hypothetical protein